MKRRQAFFVDASGTVSIGTRLVGFGSTGGSDSPPDPSSFSGVLAFYDSDTVAQSSNVVSSWPDQLSAHNDATAISGFEPTYNVSAVNALPGVEFTAGSNTCLQTPVLAVAGTQITIYMVALWPASDAGQIMLETQFDGVSPGISLLLGLGHAGNIGAVVSDVVGSSFTYDFPADGFNFSVPNAICETFDIGTADPPRTSLTVNGQSLALTSNLTALASTYTNVFFNIGARVDSIGGSPVAGGTFTLAALIICSGPPGPNDQANFLAWSRKKFGPLNFALVGDGDSITAGTVPVPPQSYVSVVGPINGRTNLTQNLAVSGDVSSGVISRLSTAQGFYNGMYPSVYSCFIGTNDLAGFTGSPTYLADLKANVTTIFTTMRAAGWKTIAFTLLPRGAIFENGQTAAQFELDRQDFNSWLRFQAFYDQLCDVGGDPNYGQPGQYADATYYLPDEVHLNGPTEVSVGTGYYVPAVTACVSAFV